MAELMKSKVTPAYWIDVLQDGRALKNDELVPIAGMYSKQIEMMGTILRQAIDESWKSHRMDYAFKANQSRHLPLYEFQP
jgi:hypothetical protein